MAKKSYTAKKDILHDGERYAEGDRIELDEKTEAPPLMAVGAIAPEDAETTEFPPLMAAEAIDPGEADKAPAGAKKAAAKKA